MKSAFSLAVIGLLPLLLAWKAPEPSCAFVRSKHHPSAEKLVREFLKRDYAGEMLSANAWWNSAMLCPGHIPGWDTSTVIASYSIQSKRVGNTQARFSVRYDCLGTLSTDGSFEVGEGPQISEFVLRKTPFGWRIEEPVDNQHIQIDVALAHPYLTDESRRRLKTSAGNFAGKMP